MKLIMMLSLIILMRPLLALSAQVKKVSPAKKNAAIANQVAVVDNVMEFYNSNLNSNQVKFFYGMMGAAEDTSLVGKILIDDNAKKLVKAERFDERTLILADSVRMRVDGGSIYLNAYKLDFYGKQRLSERVSYIERVIKHLKLKPVRTSMLSLFINRAEAQMDDSFEDPNVTFARRLALSADTLGMAWLGLSGGPAQAAAFRTLMSIPDKVELELDCHVNPAKDPDWLSYKDKLKFNSAGYLGLKNNNVFVPPHPQKLTYIKANGKKEIVWVTLNGNAGKKGATRLVSDVNVIGSNAQLSHEPLDNTVFSALTYQSNVVQNGNSRAVIRERNAQELGAAVGACCAMSAKKEQPSCISSFKHNIKAFEKNPAGKNTVRDNSDELSIDK